MGMTMKEGLLGHWWGNISGKEGKDGSKPRNAWSGKVLEENLCDRRRVINGL